MNSNIRLPFLGIVCAVAALFFGTAAPAQAAFVVFTNRAAFDAATTNQNSFDFSGVTAINNFAFFNSPPGFTRNGVTFQSSANLLFVIGRDLNSPDFAFTGTDFVLQNNALNSTLNIALPAGTPAFAFDIGLQADGPALITLFLSSGVATFTAPNRPGLTFFGVVSDTSLTTVSLTTTTGFGPSLANFTTAQAVPVAAVPEPASACLMAIGGLSLFVVRRLRRESPVI